ncbi:MAG: serine/threonine protein kinase [Cytophagales bacterium]|nr:MAG: serine/threonine protein kinase [Cytophagales bacterium]
MYIYFAKKNYLYPHKTLLKQGMIPAQILNYVVERKIGEGGMGTVFLAHHLQLNRKAAIKALHPLYVSNPYIRERFRQEAALLAELKHPTIVSLYDYLEEPQGLYLIMEYIEGKPLDEYISQVSGPISEAKTLQIMAEVLEGFEYAHNRGIVHRDIKPSNLIVTDDFHAKILDFGIAKIVEDNKALTKVGTRMGTVLYMSPEQVKGEPTDKRSDVYALGVTLFQMVTGRVPYNENKATEYEIYSEIVNNPLPRANTFYPSVSAHIQHIIDKATAKNPADRFQSCALFKEALLKHSSSEQPIKIQSTQQSQKTTTTKNKVKNKNTTSYTFWFFALFLLLLVSAIVFLNPFGLSIFKKIAFYNNEKQDLTKKYAYERQLRQKAINNLIAYYQALETHNFDNVAPFYAEKVNKYFSYIDVRPDPDIKASLRNGWKTYPYEKHDIDTTSIIVEEDSLQNYSLQYEYIYHYKNQNNTQNKQVKRTGELKFDKNWKIFYVTNLENE